MKMEDIRKMKHKDKWNHFITLFYFIYLSYKFNNQNISTQLYFYLLDLVNFLLEIGA